ncbi:PREDICTED: leucine-rich repeat extensin-like protein 3 [Prunus mume]|uniref:Leucine-rich repeat extensin-like protein 3 n=1 Tax=Prunus mume TaxID=102107 RepID=A0ABM1LSR8_PRUMU|nr:PREDICTED: leucine-rich repeat extensin-like protein 3 [Prunus mume]
MATFSFFASLLISILLVHLCLYHEVESVHDQLISTHREALEIIIGGGGVSSPPPPSPEYENCPPPPPPPCPPLPSPLPPQPTPSPSPPPPTPSPPPPPSPPSPPSPPPPHSAPPPPSPPPSPKPKPPPPPPPPPSPPPSPKPKPPSPSPPPSPKPPPRTPAPGKFESERIKLAYYVFKNFRPLIKDDPKNYKKSWRGRDVCKYKGVVCAIHPDYKQRAVAGLDINGALFGGYNAKLPLDGFLDKLEDLAFFHANSNNFTGFVPKDVYKLKFFYELDLSNNKLIGGFPNEVLAATNLTFLDLRFNSFAGSVTPEVFKLDVDVLFLNNNNFNQKIPDNLGSSPAHYFTFANNKFTGPIPRSIGQACKTLFEVLFLGNSLTGCLPYEIGYLNQATVFDVSSNFLTGPIPHSFSCLAKIDYLNLANNSFYGPVPEQVCTLSNLRNFYLANNYFTEVGPECRKLIKKKVLDVRQNCILGQPNQKTKAQCTAFFSKPRKCPNEKEMTYVPCKRHLGSNEKKPEHQKQASAPLSYGSLVPHRL